MFYTKVLVLDTDSENLFRLFKIEISSYPDSSQMIMKELSDLTTYRHYLIPWGKVVIYIKLHLAMYD